MKSTEMIKEFQNLLFRPIHNTGNNNVATLAHWFDPGGFATRAVKVTNSGLKRSTEDRTALIVFLKTS